MYLVLKKQQQEQEQVHGKKQSWCPNRISSHRILSPHFVSFNNELYADGARSTTLTDITCRYYYTTHKDRCKPHNPTTLPVLLYVYFII